MAETVVVFLYTGSNYVVIKFGCVKAVIIRVFSTETKSNIQDSGKLQRSLLQIVHFFCGFLVLYKNIMKAIFTPRCVACSLAQNKKKQPIPKVIQILHRPVKPGNQGKSNAPPVNADIHFVAPTFMETDTKTEITILKFVSCFKS